MPRRGLSAHFNISHSESSNAGNDAQLILRDGGWEFASIFTGCGVAAMAAFGGGSIKEIEAALHGAGLALLEAITTFKELRSIGGAQSITPLTFPRLITLPGHSTAKTNGLPLRTGTFTQPSASAEGITDIPLRATIETPPGAYTPPASATVAAEAEAPRPLRRASSPAEPFPVDALGRILGGATRAIVDKIMCPEAMAGSSVLAVASLAAQLHADVILPVPGHVRPLSLFLVSVAGTGERKSAADGEAARPIRKHEKRLREQYEEDLIDYRREKRAFDVSIANAEKTKGDTHEIKLAIEAVGEEPPAPLLPIMTTDEPTIEGLHKLFEKGQPSLGLFSDEGGSFLWGPCPCQREQAAHDGCAVQHVGWRANPTHKGR